MLKRLFYSLIAVGCSDMVTVFLLLESIFNVNVPTIVKVLSYIFFPVALIIITIHPNNKKRPQKRLQILDNGCELLYIFLISTAVTTVLQLFAVFTYCNAFSLNRIVVMPMSHGTLIGGIVVAVLAEGLVFWGGMLRIFATSVQLGIKLRVIAVLLGLVPVANICCLIKMLVIVAEEVNIESEKIILDNSRADKKICATKYPVLFVHGVFFRDFRFLNYWGRVPDELIKNGAVVYYGNQESAGSVDFCGKQISERIKQIVEETGCEKVNIIAHSKGGLDSRAAITKYGAAPYTASLTTINTPHNGCMFANHLLKTIPENIQNTIAETYNKALFRLGDKHPDFMEAVTCLTDESCLEFNNVTPDCDGVFYQSTMSYCRKATSGQFPLNLSYNLVKHYDGKNDGLVAIDSAKWGEKFTLVEPKYNVGISHGDMIDLNRKNIRGFDVREFYVKIVSDLKDRGL